MPRGASGPARWALAFALVVPVAAHASGTYTVRAWSPDEGLPTSTVNNLVQAPDGTLWISTTGGLARFDGLRFELYGTGHGLPSNRTQGVVVAADGRLLVATESDSLSYWDGTRFTSVPLPVPVTAHSLVRLPDGGILGNSSGLVWRVDGMKTRALGIRIAPLDVPVPGRDGRVWVITPRLEPGVITGGRLAVLGPPGSDRDRWIADPRGAEPRLWRRDGADAELLDTSLRRLARLAGAANEVPFLVDPEGRLWSADAKSFVVRDAARGVVIERIRFPFPMVVSRLVRDRDGNFWAGTFTNGLVRIVPSALRVLRPRGAEEPVQVHTVRETPDGTVLATDRSLRTWRAAAADLEPAPGADGYWLPGFEGDGRTRYRVSRAGIEIRDSAGRGGAVALPAISPAGIVADPAQPLAVYVGAGELLHRVSADPSDFGVRSPLPGQPILKDVHVDRRGRLWAATASGLWRIAAGETLRFTRRDGLPVEHCRQIHERPDGSLWIGTYGGGLVRWRDGRFDVINRERGLLEDVVSVVLEDDDGNLWLAGNAGIQRVAVADAESVLAGRRARVSAVGYGRPAGLLNPEGSGQPGLRSRDGRLWFPTFDGVAVVDPALEKRLAAGPPTPLIDGVQAGARAVPRGQHGFVLAPGENRLEIRYTGVDLRSPEQVRFRYRLAGVDPGWVDAGTARTATYTHVPPGRHVFELLAIGGDGAVVPAPARIAIEVRPQPWETAWFRAALVVALAFALWRASQWRTRRLAARSRALERAVEERTAELREEQARTRVALATVEAQADRLAALDRARSRFFASVSHEFRTPLTLIQGPLGDLHAELHGALRPDAREQVAIALDSAARLHRLVDQLLDAARVEAGEFKVERRPGDLLGFLEGLALGFAPLAERRRIAFARWLPPGPVAAAFDASALEKVFANLLGNAFKFTPEGGNVTLSARRIADAGHEWLEVAVSDDGPGIPPSDLPHVFKRFYRSESAVTRVQPGTGLGLALARDMVEQHEGAIAVESVVGSGSTFTVRLPLLPDGAAVASIAAPAPADLAALADEIRVTPLEPPPSAEGDADPEAPLVLVVEDHADVRAYVTRRLRSVYRVVEAADGAQALDRLRREVADVVVSDVAMPGMGGVELCRAIRADAELEFVPVVLLTAAASTESRVAGIESGADDYLTKPFEVRELLARISQLLHVRRRLRERVARAAAAAVVYGPEPGASGDAASDPSRFGPSPATARAHAVNAAFLARLREVIEARMGEEDFDVDRLAEAMGMGRTLLYQRVAELLDRTPMETLFDHRLERAAHMLAAGEGNVGEVAYAVGFRSISHFSRRFRDRHGVTPSEWRRTRGGQTGRA